ncbi:MAG: hypothetical protein WCD12_05610 [Candidatus Binatus sp.]|jgi:hypothetical protein|uniref:hypothetical protein n=1 Tax=Candidatus Binatus sp. TaxID=2811406 RepID=UPI003C725FFF
MKTGTTILAALSLFALLGSGCGRGPHPGPPPADGKARAASNDVTGVWANSVFGSVDVKQMANLCAGHVQLAQGNATVNDACFTGDTNVVLCTDATSANAVQCAAASGKLALAGTGSDLINFARVR